MTPDCPEFPPENQIRRGEEARIFRYRAGMTATTGRLLPFVPTGELAEPPTLQRRGRGGPDALSIGRQIRHHRRSRDLTLAELADRVGLSASALSLVENGKREPRVVCSPTWPVPWGWRWSRSCAAGSRRAGTPWRSPGSGPSAPLVSTPSGSRRCGSVPACRPMRWRRSSACTRPSSGCSNSERRRRSMRGSPTRTCAAACGRPTTTSRRSRPRLRGSLGAIDHGSGPITRSGVDRLAAHVGYSIVPVDTLPASTRTVTDMVNRRIYVPPVQSRWHGTGGRLRCRRWDTWSWTTNRPVTTPSSLPSGSRSTTSRRQC